MIKEIDLGGIFLPPLFGYLAGAGAVWYVATALLDRFGFYRYVWHPALFNTALYVILLCLFVIETL